MKSIAIFLSALVFCFGAVACSAEHEDGPLIALPDPAAAPEFDLAGPEGRRYRMSDYRGKPVIVNFWATWCPPCRAEMPSLERAWQQLQGEGIGVVAVNVGEDADVVEEFLAQTPVTFPLPLDLDSEVAEAWLVRGLPTTFVVDAEGRTAYVATGEREWDSPAVLEQVRALSPSAE